MNVHRPSLANPMDPIVALLLDGRIPPAREMDHVCRGRKSEPDASRLGPKHQQVEPAIVFEMTLKAIYNRLPLRDRRFAVYEVYAVQFEFSTCELNKTILKKPMLDEYKRSFPTLRNPPQDIKGGC